MTPEQHPDLDELILYCMGTLDAESDAAAGERVRRHLTDCPNCTAKAVHLRADLALLAMTVPQVAPPAEAKTRLLQAAGIDPSQTSSASASQNFLPMKPRRRSPALVWGGWIAAAVCLLYAVQLRDASRRMHQQLQTETAEIVQLNTSASRAQEVLDVLSSPQAQRVTLISAHSKPEPTGHAIYLRDRGALVFTASNLAPLPPNKTYELWVIPANGTAPIPAGTFQPDTRGMASVLLPSLPRGVQAKAFGVTMENSGGSSTPTMPILLAGG